MKKFIIKSFIYFLPFGCICVSYKFLSQNFAGDIGTIVKLPFKNYDKYAGYTRSHRFSENLVIDTLIMSNDKLQIGDSLKIITIGDSSSDLGIWGYQNYLAHSLNNRILNIRFKVGLNHLNTAIALLNSEMIDSVNCHIMILQIVDRHVIKKLSSLDSELLYEPPKNIDEYIWRQKEEVFNLQAVCTFIRLRLGFKNPITTLNLKKKCFTHLSFSKKLLFYTDGDLRFLNTTTPEIEKATENLILLRKKFSEKGIKMIFLISADKYDVYRPFLKDDSYPVDTTTDGLSKIPDICIINTKPLFQDMVRNGEMDMYMLHDTHWSYKACEAVAHEIFCHIDAPTK
jgi:hypothetical protein